MRPRLRRIRLRRDHPRHSGQSVEMADELLELAHRVKDPAFADSLSGATTNLRTLTDRLNAGQGTAGKLLTDTALYDRANQLTNRLNDVLTRLNDGEGTAGQLLKDRQLYENMNKTVLEFQALLAEIKKDPKRYLNVRVSIF